MTTLDLLEFQNRANRPALILNNIQGYNEVIYYLNPNYINEIYIDGNFSEYSNNLLLVKAGIF